MIPPLRRGFLALPALLLGTATAQDNAIKLYVGAAAGTGIDLSARGFAAPFGQALRATVLVINRPSAGGVLAAESVAQAAPDGRSLLYSSLGPLAVAPQTIRPLPYHPLNSFTHLARLACGGFVIAVPAQSPAHDLPGLIAHLRLRGGAANYATSMGAMAYRLAAEMLQQAAGTRAQHVPFRTTGEVLTALSTNQVEFAIDLRGPLQPLAHQGEIRLLAVTSAESDPALPMLPPLARYYPGVVLESWVGFSAPRGLPPAQQARMAEAAAFTLRDPAVQTMLGRSGAVPAYMPGQAYTAFIAQELTRITQLAQHAGLTA